MLLHATLITRDNQNTMLSIENGQGNQKVYWPTYLMPQSLQIGDNFEIAIGEKLMPRQEISEGKSVEELRELLYDLIN